MPFTENLAPFFNVAEFADAATLDGVAVAGIFENGYSELFAMTAHDARFMLPASATTAAATTSSVVALRGKAWRVRSVQDDGTGLTTLLLERS